MMDGLSPVIHVQRLMKLQFDQVSAFVKTACVSLPVMKKQHGGGRQEAGRPPSKRNAEKLFYLKRLCGKQNENNLKEDGPYGQACVILKMTNSKRNRKQMRTLWKRNKGTSSVETKSDYCVSDEPTKTKDYNYIGNVLRKYLTPTNESNISPNGPYAKSALKLGCKNTRSERLCLYVTWRENRGNVKISETDFNVRSIEEEINTSSLGKKKNAFTEQPHDAAEQTENETPSNLLYSSNPSKNCKQASNQIKKKYPKKSVAKKRSFLGKRKFTFQQSHENTVQNKNTKFSDFFASPNAVKSSNSSMKNQCEKVNEDENVSLFGQTKEIFFDQLNENPDQIENEIPYGSVTTYPSNNSKKSFISNSCQKVTEEKKKSFLHNRKNQFLAQSHERDNQSENDDRTENERLSGSLNTSNPYTKSTKAPIKNHFEEVSNNLGCSSFSERKNPLFEQSNESTERTETSFDFSESTNQTRKSKSTIRKHCQKKTENCDLKETSNEKNNTSEQKNTASKQADDSKNTNEQEQAIENEKQKQHNSTEHNTRKRKNNLHGKSESTDYKYKQSNKRTFSEHYQKDSDYKETKKVKSNKESRVQKMPKIHEKRKGKITSKFHCICKSTRYTWWRKSDSDMIQCCRCNIWYHYSCLSLPKHENHKRDNYKFECGLEHCPSYAKPNTNRSNNVNHSAVNENCPNSTEDIGSKILSPKDQFLVGLGLQRVCRFSIDSECESDKNASNKTMQHLAEDTYESKTEKNDSKSKMTMQYNNQTVLKQQKCLDIISNAEQINPDETNNVKDSVVDLMTNERKIHAESTTNRNLENVKVSDSNDNVGKVQLNRNINSELQLKSSVIKNSTCTVTNKTDHLNSAEKHEFHEFNLKTNLVEAHDYEPDTTKSSNNLNIKDGKEELSLSNSKFLTSKHVHTLEDSKCDLINDPEHEENKSHCPRKAKTSESTNPTNSVTNCDINLDIGATVENNKLTEQERAQYKEMEKIYSESEQLTKKIIKIPLTIDSKIKNEMVYIEEMLIQCLEKLDAINCDSQLFKPFRKHLADFINAALNSLDDRKVSTNEQMDCSDDVLKNQKSTVDASNSKVPKDSKSGPCNSQQNENLNAVLSHQQSSKPLLKRKQPNKSNEKCMDEVISNAPEAKRQKFAEKLEKIHFEESEHSDSDCSSENDKRFSKQTISSVLGCEIPQSDYFTKDLQSEAKFELKVGIFDSLYKERKGRYFQRGSWEQYFVEGLKRSNPYCVFAFDHHECSVAEKRKRKAGSKIFHANGKCVFSTCPVKFHIKMLDKITVNVIYSGDVNHLLNEKHSRNITGDDRENLKEQFKGGIKPLTKYLESIDKTSAEILVSGNVDGMGKNSRVFAQIACESRQDGRKHADALQSLLFQQEDMKKSCSVGFIQKVCANPLYVFYWTKAGLTLYHEKSSTDALFWDATGSVCRRNDDGKQMLYYELAIKHPVKGKMGIPVTSMVSSDQSLPVVCDWIKSFRHGEKKLFGFSKLTIPKLIISDQSMVFILAALHEFNGEDMSSFLTRCWNLANGVDISVDSKKTMIHLCASHFMNSCKKYIVKRIGKKNKVRFLYMIGLLMNCSQLSDAQELLKDIYIALLSPSINDLNTAYIDRLLRKINNFDPGAESEFDTEIDQSAVEESNLNPNIFSEEEYQSLGTKSKFREWSNRISAEVSEITQKMPDSRPPTNPLFCPEFHQYLKTKLMPIYPLWSILLVSDMFPGNQTIIKTNSTIENRFRILKHIGLNGRSQHRIDEFSEALYRQTIGVQKLSCLESLKYRLTPKATRRKFPKTGKKSLQETTEQWNKPKSQPLNFKDSEGKYQKKPSKEINIAFKSLNKVSIPHTEQFSSESEDTVSHPCSEALNCDNSSEFCLLPNYGSTCWFNSMTQALAASSFSKRIVEEVSNNTSVSLDGQTEVMDLAVKGMADLLSYMHSTNGKGSKVPDRILQPAIRKVVAAVPGFSQQEQQDVDEFNTSVVNAMSEMLLEKVEFSCKEKCNVCDKITIRDTTESQSLVFTVLPEIDNISVQTLADNILFSDTRLKFCSNCKKDQVHNLSKSITDLPRTLFIVLRRYQNSADTPIQKLHNNIFINDEITIKHQSGKSNYKMKSVVCHIGETVHSGHYTTVVKRDDQLFCCDDTTIARTDESYMLDTAYIVVYDRIQGPIPAFIKPFLECFSKCQGISEMMKDDRLKHLKENKQNLLRVLCTAGVTSIIEEDLLTYFDPFIERKWHLNLQDLDIVAFYEAFLQFLLNDSSVGCRLSAEYLEICSHHVWKCQSCKLLDIERSSKLILNLQEFQSEQIKQSLQQSQIERPSRQCKCNKSRQAVLTSMPSSFIIRISQCTSLLHGQLDEIDIGNMLPHIASNGHSYQLKYIMCKKDGNFFKVFNKSAGFFRTGLYVNGLPAEASGMDEVVLFYDKICQTDYIQANIVRMHNDASLTFDCQMNLPMYTKFPNMPHRTNITIRGVKISKKFMSSICNCSGWLTSDNIDVYLHLLSENTSKKVHMVDSGWFSQILLRNNNPHTPEWLITRTESKASWFDNELIFIPINENNRHWTLVVIQTKERRLWFCDSFSSNANASHVCFQVLRYLSFECLMHTGNCLNYNEWTVACFNKQYKFPFQTDGSSCGVYVCATVRAMISNKHLPSEINLLSFRKLMANEIYAGSIETPKALV